jgi:hypothetical protein
VQVDQIGHVLLRGQGNHTKSVDQFADVMEAEVGFVLVR